MELFKTSRIYDNKGFIFEIVQTILDKDRNQFIVWYAGHGFEPSRVPDFVIERDELIEMITKMEETTYQIIGESPEGT